MIELAGDDLQVSHQAGFQPGDELLGLEAMRLHGGNVSVQPLIEPSFLRGRWAVASGGDDSSSR